MLAQKFLITYDLFVLMITRINEFNILVQEFNVIRIFTYLLNVIWTP
jgi:hypothetical protein